MEDGVECRLAMDVTLRRITRNDAVGCRFRVEAEARGACRWML